MKKLMAGLCLAAAVLAPAVTQAFTVTSPVFTDRLLMECRILNVGNIVLQTSPFWIADDGQKVWVGTPWADLPPGADVSTGYYNPVPHKSCGFSVRAKSKRRTATRNMIRGVVHFIDTDHRRVALELK